MTTSDQIQPTETSNLPQPGPLSWLRFSLFWLVACGLAYPVVTTFTAGTLFPAQANGSLITRGGAVVGSGLVAQTFTGDQYFIGRPSAAGAGNDPTNASGSNLAPSNPALRERVAATSAEIAAREGVPASQIPADLVTASGGGLDPHISLAGAAIQVARVARVRGLSANRVRELIAANTQSGVLGLGQPGVNVLRLNLALDAAQ
ncbi:potassium-transporting ATPase subunit KdpC [Deinococcus sp. Arct2-2]|uniref:potassium-transporting ATPase subunit KdpC n=1 Tax=Deinococcus sp. Arct2-2 TaxID=2568653 RepID=UPI0010A3CB1A|nr:potassium-transporting ATPase subunit KdpC [Deinococcus sp. Arct2-2]THF71693.1 potassium-transporting ATPase subunit KdpC [Deinococcus sp. Arct2-2]